MKDMNLFIVTWRSYYPESFQKHLYEILPLKCQVWVGEVCLMPVICFTVTPSAAPAFSEKPEHTGASEGSAQRENEIMMFKVSNSRCNLPASSAERILTPKKLSVLYLSLV
jgi:hypothetical protein